MTSSRLLSSQSAQTVQRHLLARARAGDEQAREDLILSLQPRLHSLAWRYLRQQNARQEHLVDAMDLVNSANVALLECLSYALWLDNPLAYMLKSIRYGMLDCINGRNGTVRTHPSQDRFAVVSLDRYLDDDKAAVLLLQSEQTAVASSQTQTYLLLYQAIANLPEKQREVILRRYGLSGFTPESVNAIGRSFPARKETIRRSRHPRNAYYHNRRAILALREALAPLYQPSEENDEQ
jgi:RNA polymerase sigma factor (sigma-70 family)